MKPEYYLAVQRALKSELDEMSKLVLKTQEAPRYLRSLVADWVQEDEKKFPMYDPNFIRKDFEILEKRQRDEIVLSFLTFLGKTLVNEKVLHVFVQPYSEMYNYWYHLFYSMLTCLVSLVYGKLEWDAQEVLAVDRAMIGFCSGDPSASRVLFRNLNLVAEEEEKATALEKKFFERNVYTPHNWGPLVWRLLHLVAESVHVRGDEFAPVKEMWFFFVKKSLYRCLPCPECSFHYRNLAAKYDKELGSATTFPETWYEVHNEVNVNTSKPKYEKEEFEKDRKIMRDMLSTTRDSDLV